MDINIWAILASAVASIVIGSIWFGPLFRKQFMEASGMDKMTPEQRSAAGGPMTTTYIVQLVASIVMFYVLARLVADTGEMTLSGGLMTAFWAWLGFVVPTQLGYALWGGSMKMFWLTAGNMLITLLAAGAIIGGWR
jgi:hypothetical protein